MGASSKQQIGDITVNSGKVLLTARDTINNYSYNYGNPQQAEPRTINMAEVLALVSNLRQVHLEVLSKATPGTAVWILRTDYFLLWLDPNGDLKILWGSGIRKCIQLCTLQRPLSMKPSWRRQKCDGLSHH